MILAFKTRLSRWRIVTESNQNEVNFSILVSAITYWKISWTNLFFENYRRLEAGDESNLLNYSNEYSKYDEHFRFLYGSAIADRYLGL